MRKQTISLVLGSGGARGLAHIGVIQWLLQNNYSIHSISGASMGALVGGIYACGQLDAYARWVSALERLDVIRLLDFSFSRRGLFKGERIINTLKDLIGDHLIEELPVTYTAIATDLERGREIWLNEGSLFDAIRASIAIPTIVTPHHYLGRNLVDGALVNPLPIAPTLGDRTDLTVAVSLSGPPITEEALPHEELQAGHNGYSYHQKILQFITNLQNKQDKAAPVNLDFFDVLARSMDTMQNAITRFQLAAYTPDVVIEIPRNACNFFEFHRAKDLIELGQQQAGLYMSVPHPSSHPVDVHGH